MNKAITDGLTLMPTPFSAGLNVWTSGDGRPGGATYAANPNAAFVPSDPDFGGCLELVKTSTNQRVRYMVQTPYQPGMYLRVTVRIKAITGNLPTVAVTGLALNASNNPVGGLAEFGPSVTLAQYGQVVTVSAIIGSGNRTGVNMVWGMTPVAAHLGLTLTGPNGGTVRIDDIEIEDVTSVFHRTMMDWVDVRDYGALGDGTTNDAPAFALANAAALAQGRVVLVSAGSYALTGNVTMTAPVRFEGTVVMPAANRLVLQRNYDIETYTSAFGSEPEGFRRALQALFHLSDHVVLDLGGRTVTVSGPIDVAALAGLQGASFVQRRVIDNGQLVAQAGAGWTVSTVSSQATYSTANPTILTGVANIANIEVGSLVSGTGMPRETYVRSRNVAAGTLELSLQAGASSGTRTYTFTRYRYMLDFSGFGRVDKMELTNLEMSCEGNASGIMLPPVGIVTRIHGCVIDKPRDRAITSIGTGCQGLIVDECQFLSNEQALLVQDRVTVCMNINTNDVKIRDNRIVRFKHFCIAHGSGHLFIGNHFFQGDPERPGVRQAGLIFTGINVKSSVASNYIDNCFIELTNERESDPNWNNQFSFGGLTVTGNVFTTLGAMPSFAWLVVTPYGTGHYIQGLSVTGNTFRAVNGNITRADKVDTTFADLDRSRFRNIVVHGNNWNGINQPIYNPHVVNHQQSSASTVWTVDGGSFLPFDGWARVVPSLVAQGPISGGGQTRYDMPYVEIEQGPDKNRVNLRWPVATTGRVQVTVRVDQPS